MIGCLDDHRPVPTRTVYDAAASTRNAPEQRGVQEYRGMARFGPVLARTRRPATRKVRSARRVRSFGL